MEQRFRLDAHGQRVVRRVRAGVERAGTVLVAYRFRWARSRFVWLRLTGIRVPLASCIFRM